MQGLWLIAFIVQWILVLGLVVLVIGILRYLASIQERWNLAIPTVSSYELHQHIGEFELPDRTGTMLKSRNLLHQSGAVLLFITAGCQSCTTLLAQVSELVTRRNLVLARPLILIAIGDRKKVEQLLSMHVNLASDRVMILIDEKSAVLHQFGISSLPTGLAVDHEGRLMNQTFNPHAAHWLYKIIEVTPPEQPVTQNMQAIISPAAYRG